MLQPDFASQRAIAIDIRKLVVRAVGLRLLPAVA